MQLAAPLSDFACRLCVVQPVFNLIHDTHEELEVVFEDETYGRFRC